MIAVAYKFAFLAKVNAGTLSSLFSMTSFLIAVVFYFAFGESISCTKILGMVCILTCAVLIGLDKKGSDEDSSEEVEAMVHYGILAILTACCAPIFWATRVYFFRKFIDTRGFDPTGLALDGNMWTAIIGSILCIFFFINYECSSYDFILACFAGIFILFG